MQHLQNGGADQINASLVSAVGILEHTQVLGHLSLGISKMLPYLTQPGGYGTDVYARSGFALSLYIHLFGSLGTHTGTVAAVPADGSRFFVSLFSKIIVSDYRVFEMVPDN